jgi:hypothetical protein
MKQCIEYRALCGLRGFQKEGMIRIDLEELIQMEVTQIETR